VALPPGLNRKAISWAFGLCSLHTALIPDQPEHGIKSDFLQPDGWKRGKGVLDKKINNIGY
jgi:hypothetical protein